MFNSRTKHLLETLGMDLSNTWAGGDNSTNSNPIVEIKKEKVDEQPDSSDEEGQEEDEEEDIQKLLLEENSDFDISDDEEEAGLGGNTVNVLIAGQNIKVEKDDDADQNIFDNEDDDDDYDDDDDLQNQLMLDQDFSDSDEDCDADSDDDESVLKTTMLQNCQRINLFKIYLRKRTPQMRQQNPWRKTQTPAKMIKMRS